MNQKEFFDSVASEYEEKTNSEPVKSYLTKTCKEIFDKHNITSGTILDIGCGPGNLKTELGENFEYTGIDFSEKMLEIAKQKGYKTILGKVEDVIEEIEDKSFDYVVCLGTLLFIEDAEVVINRIKNIARKGWLIGLDDETEAHIRNYPHEGKVYNHSKLEIDNLTEDIYRRGWTSPTTRETINTRFVFKLNKA